MAIFALAVMLGSFFTVMAITATAQQPNAQLIATIPGFSRPVNYNGETITVGTFQVSKQPGDHFFVAGALPGGSQLFLCDDALRITGPNGVFYHDYNGYQLPGEIAAPGSFLYFHNPQEFTSVLHDGANTITVTVEDTMGGAIGIDPQLVLYKLPSQLVASFTYSGIHDGTTNNKNVLGVSTSDVDAHPMVGGKIRFDASKSTPQGSITQYDWTFVGASDHITVSRTSNSPTLDLMPPLAVPQMYTVTLTVRDANGNTNTTSKPLDLSLKPGDLIFVRSAWWTLLFPGQAYTHVGMYVGDGRVIEAVSTPAHGGIAPGVQKDYLFGYFHPDGGGTETFATVYRVYPRYASLTAVSWATAKQGLPYDFNVFRKEKSFIDTLQIYLSSRGKELGAYNAWYCSELVWAAYWQASYGSIDLGRTGPSPLVPVWPDTIAGDQSHLQFVGGHWEHYPS
jgi:cell wall-associated NlpC family hydrolase